MSVIYSFLQKRKMHESQHGYVLVIVAYVLSALMLLLGSDLFYDINTKAAGATTEETKEETQNAINENQNASNYYDYTEQLQITGIINPYGLKETSSDKEVEKEQNSISTSGDTVWLFGNAMDGDTFDSLMKQIGSIKQAKKEEQKKKVAVKSTSASKAVRTKYGKITTADVKMLERIVQAEAGGEDMKGKILIVNVIMNRVASNHFPDTIKGVIFQKKNGGYQFSPVGNGRFWSVRISKDTKKAVAKALDGVDYSKGALYFVSRRRANPSSMRWFDRKLDWLFKHGGHEFYKNK